MNNIDVPKRLAELKDSDYRSFHIRLIPTVDESTVIGVRVPQLRKLAGELWKSGQYASFMRELPHRYYEEYNLHAFLIEKIKDYNMCIRELDRFLPYVDNWATCDSLSPPIFKSHTAELYNDIKRWLKCRETYTVRFAVKTLMNRYSGEKFAPEHLDVAASAVREEYYIKMAVAWYFSTVMTFHFDEVCTYLQKHTLDTWTHNKAIQKAKESYRLSAEQKRYIEFLKI